MKTEMMIWSISKIWESCNSCEETEAGSDAIAIAAFLGKCPMS